VILDHRGSDPAGHNAMMDAIKSIRLFNHYHQLRVGQAAMQLLFHSHHSLAIVLAQRKERQSKILLKRAVSEISVS
jgi:hypothetical protein